MAQNNSINNRTGQLTIDPGTSGDSFIQYAINATNEWRVGCDDSASDAYVLSQGSALGTTNVVSISANGEMRKELTAAFLATNTTAQNNVTGDGTVYGAAFSTEIFDQNSDYSTPNFTAPISGRYYLYFVAWPDTMNLLMTSSYAEIVTSNATYRGFYIDFASNIGAGSGAISQESLKIDFFTFADMDAGDTAFVQLYIAGSTKTVDLIGTTSAGYRSMAFGGFLVC